MREAVSDPALARRYHDADHALPGEAGEAGEERLAAFFPDQDGRYDFATIAA